MTTERTGMEKERLLNYFQEHYLSRREVLFRLPLNLSIGNFWAELLNRRKAGAVVLPLYDANGMPYWYSLTPKMIAASEKLCAAAMRQPEEFDPYRMQMTAAMTEEMYFTSFVEGAQIPLEDAMDFLQRGTEPENIQEQLIWNNRQAWTMLTRNLHRPIDENYVKMLGYLLTDGMDDCAEDYRQSDEHFIPSMEGEPYILPSAVNLPNRMAEFSNFLEDGDIHPLIKASAGQAYILIARPFPEGNERLSRMISSAVLLRSGYDFFRDISISAAIARENYGYYKAMREILRTENGGDLTYFMEYYLGLLVRAMEAEDVRKRERDHRRDEEALERERSLARRPLSFTKPGEIPRPGELQTSAEPFESDTTFADTVQMKTTRETEELPKSISDIMDGAESISAFSTEAEKDFSTVPEVQPKESPPKAENKTRIDAGFEEKLRAMEHNLQFPGLPREAGCIREAIEKGFCEFTMAEWRKCFGLTGREAATFIQYLKRHDMVEWQEGKGIHVYRLKTNMEPGQNTDMNTGMSADANTIGHTDENLKPVETLSAEEFMRRLDEHERQSQNTGRNAAELLRRMIADGKREFTCDEWVEELGVSRSIVYDVMGRFRKRGLITCTGVNANRRYCVTLRNCNAQTDDAAPTGDSGGVLEEHTVEASPQMLTLLEQMASENATPRDQRIGAFLLNAIQEGKTEFETSDWAAAFDETESQCLEDMRKAANMGLIQRNGTGIARTRCRICFQPKIGMCLTDLSKQQKELLTAIYKTYKKDCFRLTELCRQLDVKSSSIAYHFTNFRERGIMSVRPSSGNILDYALEISPKSHPECFLIDAGGTEIRSAIEKRATLETPSNAKKIKTYTNDKTEKPAAVLSAVAG